MSVMHLNTLHSRSGEIFWTRASTLAEVTCVLSLRGVIQARTANSDHISPLFDHNLDFRTSGAIKGMLAALNCVLAIAKSLNRKRMSPRWCSQRMLAKCIFP